MAGDDGRGGKQAAPRGLESTAPLALGPAEAAAVGAQIGRYTIERVVGAGGMGLVVAARDHELGRLVAIKFVAADTELAQARVVREAQAMARLSHPNVVAVHEVVRFGQRAGIVMDLVEGGDLATWCAGRRRPWREIVAAYVQAAAGLAAAHRAGLVHRDFKPANAAIDGDGVVRVTDFGLVRAAGLGEPDAAGQVSTPEELAALDQTLTATGALVGTPAYMAPEQHDGEAVDARTDQWALACSLYEALHGQRPFAGQSVDEIAAAVRAGAIRPEPPDSRVPRAVRAAIRRALSPRPADRFPSMEQLVAALSPARRRWRVAAVLGAAAAIACAVFLLLHGRAGSEVTCAGLDAPLTSVWNPARAGALRGHFAGAGAWAADGSGRVASRLDGYGASWLAARTRACEDARARRGAPGLLDRRMRCLDQRLIEMSGVVAALLDADPAVMRRAGAAIDGLHAVADCDDPRDSVARPADPRARADIAAAEDDLARGWALHAVGRCKDALPLARRATEVGERTRWSPLLARALVLRGECENRAGDYAAALATLDRAGDEAARARDDRLLAEALGTRFFVLGDRLGRPTDALAGRQYIELALERAGQPPRERAIWLHVLATVLSNQGTLDEALAAETEAVATWRKIVPPDHVNLLDALQTMAEIQISRREFDRAVALLDQNERTEIATRGPDDPRVASLNVDHGVADAMRGDLSGAVKHWERALAIERAAGITSKYVGMYNVGLAQLALGRWREAHAMLTRALAVADATAPGATTPVAMCASALGAATMALGQIDEARPLLERGVAAARASGGAIRTQALTYAAQGALARGDAASAGTLLAEAAKVTTDDDPQLIVAEGDVARAGKGCRAAQPLYQRAVAAAGVRAESVGELTDALTGLGECMVELGSAAGAVTTLEPRVAWIDQVGSDPGAAARARFALAQALAATGGDRVRARRLAESARVGFATLGAPGQRRAARIARWLERHP
ncbi:MAG TPA: serine/threonine-protein kinase [Kofleriaceae bacterium]|nr:serine/threonine-protein kinase [Kofleriaceae bacterium]